MTVMTDEELCKRVQNGDSEAQDELLKRYKNKVLAIARRFFLGGAETEDLVQEGMCGLYTAIINYSPEKGGFAPFANTCVRNRITDKVRSAKNNKNLALNSSVPIEDVDGITPSPLNPEDELIKDESLSEFYAALAKNLSSLEFKVMVMYIDGLTLAEISSALNIGVKSVDNAVTRARRKLQKFYGSP